MNPIISIPREALAELLRASGSPLTPEEYVASLSDLNTYRKYAGRAKAAAISKYTLLIVAIFGVLFAAWSTLFFGFDLENLIIAAGLVTVTFFEYRVHRYFRDWDPRAPSLGFRNQAAFAAAILVYCLYHAFSSFQMPLQSQTLVEENNLIDPAQLKSLARLFYLVIAIVAGGSQFALAWYYKRAEVRSDA